MNASIIEKMIDLNGKTNFSFEELATTWGFKILGSLLILIIAYFIMIFIGNIIRIAFTKTKVDDTLTKFILKLIKIIIFSVGALAALNNIGIDTTSFVALFTACSFAISFAFKETLSNIAAGVLIVIFRPFKLEDLVKCGAGEGYVADISLFSITLRTVDNTNIIVPNAKVVSDNIYNYSREKIRRIDYSKSIEPSKLCDFRDNIVEKLSKSDLILQEPPVFVGVKSIGDNNIELSIQVWVDNQNYEKAAMQTNELLTELFLDKK